MSDLRIIGAGMWRTGTISLKTAIEQLTSERCLHMTDVMANPKMAAAWFGMLHGGPANWPRLLDGFVATMDWPAMAYWPELAAAYPDAKILLSTRDPESWWISISQTVLASAPTRKNARTPWQLMVVELFEKKFVGRNPTKEQAIDFYNKHNQQVRATIEPKRLIEWSPGDGWQPLCKALDLPVPDTDFPRMNSSLEYRLKNHLPVSD